jgi:hypothetical protein
MCLECDAMRKLLFSLLSIAALAGSAYAMGPLAPGMIKHDRQGDQRTIVVPVSDTTDKVELLGPLHPPGGLAILGPIHPPCGLAILGPIHPPCGLAILGPIHPPCGLVILGPIHRPCGLA